MQQGTRPPRSISRWQSGTPPRIGVPVMAHNVGDDAPEFAARNRAMTTKMAADEERAGKSLDWTVHSAPHQHSYHFTWLGRPIIQHPQDVLAIQDIIWTVRSDYIAESGIARCGSLVLSAST